MGATQSRSSITPGTPSSSTTLSSDVSPMPMPMPASSSSSRRHSLIPSSLRRRTTSALPPAPAPKISRPGSDIVRTRTDSSLADDKRRKLDSSPAKREEEEAIPVDPGESSGHAVPSLAPPLHTTPSLPTSAGPPVPYNSTSSALREPDPPPAAGEQEAEMSALLRQLDQAASELADVRRRVDEERAQMERTGPVPMTTTAGQGQAEGRGQVPAGAVLVIQGLAQAQQPTAGAGEGLGHDRWGLRRRRSRDRRSGEEEREESERALDSQARMIGGLLTVAAAATATTLLNPPSPSPRPAPSPLASTASPSQPSSPNPTSSLIASILSRLRPANSSSSPSSSASSASPAASTETRESVESALGDYIRSFVRRSSPPGEGEGEADVREGENGDRTVRLEPELRVTEEFSTFLEGLQGDLIEAVREFAGVGQGGGDNTSDVDTEVRAEAMEEEVISHSEEVVDEAPSPTRPRQLPLDGRLRQALLPENDPEPSIPGFHPQPGQNLASSTAQQPSRHGVSGGTDGLPRRLNFFRAHIFPPAAQAADDPSAIVPCIFIGVRSIAHDPTLTTEDLVAHPSFPFVDGNVPPGEGDDEAAPGEDEDDEDEETGDQSLRQTISSRSDLGLRRTTSTSTTSTSPVSSPALPSIAPRRSRSMASRLLSRLTPSSLRPSSPAPPRHPLNTYLVYVIGGNYPRHHPVLAIPALLTGQPLTDEEMTLVGELMGQVKPPTVSKGEIEESGLRVVKAGDWKVEGEGQGGGEEEGEGEGKVEVLRNCVERCLICLSDYEPEDECRILKCRHAFHKDCVDHWLCEGRNNCPACRSEAVDKQTTAHEATATTAQIQDSEAPTSGPEQPTAEGTPSLDPASSS